jgi:hypothetical protein
MIAKCCKECERCADPDTCANAFKCVEWRLWFHDEWERIQRIAKKIKEAEK